jgi:hypothetical protein
MSTHSTDGRPWAKLSELKPGDVLIADGDFDCVTAGEECEVKADEGGALYVDCAGPIGPEEPQQEPGKHLLDGQLSDVDGDSLVGFWLKPAPETQRIEVDIGKAAEMLQANPELAAMMNELVGGPALVAAQAEVERLAALVGEMRAALRPFAELVETSNGYEDSPADMVVRSAGTLGRDYVFITVGDCRAARAAIDKAAPSSGGEG